MVLFGAANLTILLMVMAVISWIVMATKALYVNRVARASDFPLAI